VYFQQKDYKFAQAYYDSTMVFLPKDFKNYDQIKNKKESLTSMVKNMEIISREDSLLKVSQMDTAKISTLIDELIEKLFEEEEKKKKEAETKAQNPNSSIQDENNPWQNSPTTGSWYFYNMTSLGMGFAEFNKKWGERPLEDNWRRSNKETIMAEQVSDTSSADTSGVPGKIADNKTHTFYLKDIPFSDEQKMKANMKIMEAYYTLGSVYKELLQDNHKASETFEEMLRRYPDNKYVLNLYYQLYRIYLGMENQGRTNFYKEKILNEYPDSEYAKIIKNPDYQKALKASRNEIEKYYSETYSAYHSSRYGEVIAMVSKADSFYSGSELMPRFALLRAFSIGKTKDINDFENALQGVIAQYPKEDTKAKAQEIIDQIKKIKSAPVDSAALKDTVVIKPSFFFKDTTEHYCIIILKGKKINVNDMKARISNFNSEYFRLSDLSITSVMMDVETQVVYVKSFSVASKAKDYFDIINQDSKVFMDILISEYKVFPISSENFTVLYKEKKMDEYQIFFTDNYLKKKDE